MAARAGAAAPVARQKATKADQGLMATNERDVRRVGASMGTRKMLSADPFPRLHPSIEWLG
jgi:hypothetical protein